MAPATGTASRSTSSSRWGADNLVWCTDGGLSLEVRTSGEQAVRPGMPMALGIDPRRVSLFAADGGERL
jgi:hypothetical protein